ncbi:hypothetical protein QYG89_11210 [Bacillus sp. B190/17]|uniref:DUF2642 domain-containing protein n=1 Tax=Bacillus lumedeiriae TaxID=3058829 RepID=A0ABW8I9R9_9BACI
MLKQMKDYIGEPVHLELVGKKDVIGVLIEAGSDVVVVFNEQEFYYVPLAHVWKVKVLTKEEAEDIIFPDSLTDPPIIKKLSLLEVLFTSKGMFVELNATAGQPFHGYITNIFDDYLILFSPIYQTILIPFRHVKWLIPYPSSAQPYGFKNSMYPSSLLTTKNYALTLDEQLKNKIGTFITCNVGEKESISGKLLQKESPFIDLLTVKEQAIRINIDHIKTIVFT